MFIVGSVWYSLEKSNLPEAGIISAMGEYLNGTNHTN